MKALDNPWRVNPRDPMLSRREIREADAYIRRHQHNYRLTRKGHTYLRLMPNRRSVWAEVRDHLLIPVALAGAGVLVVVQIILFFMRALP